MTRTTAGLVALGIGLGIGQVIMSGIDGDWHRAAMIVSSQWMALATAWFMVIR